MQSIELTKPVTTESLLSEFESRFNQTMDLTKFTAEELEDVANKIRTKIHNITQNEHFGHELKNHDYQKNQAMLDVVNQKIKEFQVRNDPETMKMADKVKMAPGMKDAEKKQIIGALVSKEDVKEGVEEQSELILAAIDMMDKVTGYLEDLATMKTESMLELADRI